MIRSSLRDGIEILATGQDIEALRRVLVVAMLGRYTNVPASGQTAPTDNSASALSILLSQLPTKPVASLTSIVKGKTGIKDARPGGFPLVVTAEARASTDHFDFEGPGVIIPTVSSTGHGDASLKRIHYQEGQYAVGSILAVLQPLDANVLSARYLHAYLSAFKEELLVSRMVGTANVSLTVAKIGTIPVPLLPIAEQRKVDVLMALCDKLEAEQADSESAHAKLVETLLGTLTQSTDATDFTAKWQRLAEHFDTLFTTESSLDALRQTILQLAVMGKIVQPDPEDEPASELLKRIAQERGQLGAKGIRKKLNETLPIEQGEQPHPLPGGWAWCRFREIATVNGRLVDSLAFPDAQQVAPDNIEKGTGRLIERRTVREAGVRGPNQRFKAGQLLYSKIRPSLSKAVIADFDGLCSADMYPLDSYIAPRFLLYQILSETFLKQVRVAENRIKMPKLNQESLNAFLVGVPPLTEQHRIVAKLDELLALCDRLKAGHADACSQQERLTETLIESALKAA